MYRDARLEASCFEKSLDSAVEAGRHFFPEDVAVTLSLAGMK